MAKKRTHLLRANRRQTFPRHVIFYDNESTQHKTRDGDLEHRLLLGVAQYVDYGRKNVEEEIVYSSSNEFWDWVVSKTITKRTLYVIAHNQDFDFRLVKGFSELQKRGFHSHKLILEYPRCICTFGNYEKIRGRRMPPRDDESVCSKKSITLLDTLNWFKESLAQLGEYIGATKLDMPSYDDSIDDWVVYCRQDVVVLRKAFEHYIEFLRKHNLGTFGPTIASQALNAFKTRFLVNNIEIHTHESANALERRSYFGGRTDCFFIGKLPEAYYYKLDINSMYPYVMRENAYPTKLRGVSLCEFPKQVEQFRREHLVIADVTVKTEHPAFPFRGEDKLLFPVGEFTTALCSPELDLLDELGCEYTLHKMAVYDGAFIFEKFIDELYTMRQKFKSENNEQYQYFSKILMNSLYGKFGQQNDNWEYLLNDGTMESGVYSEIDAKSGEEKTIKKVMGECFLKTGKEDGFDTLVAISSFVTSYARALLWRLIQQAGISNVYYMDTDSLLVNQIGRDRLTEWIDSSRLGALKIEAEDTTGKIYNVKDYIFGNEIKIKGVSRKAKKLSETHYEVEVWEHFNGAVMRNRTEMVLTKKGEKLLKRAYEKGNVLPSGRTEPFRFQVDK